MVLNTSGLVARKYSESLHRAAELFWVESANSGMVGNGKPDVIAVFPTGIDPLESLLLDDGNNAELRFRLALRGAWYLGTNTEEREKYFRTLRDAYDLGSKAVHSGEITGDAREVKSTLYAAQNLCCGAIRRRIYEGVMSDWTKLVLGARPP